jgi:hypothetical protein
VHAHNVQERTIKSFQELDSNFLHRYRYDKIFNNKTLAPVKFTLFTLQSRILLAVAAKLLIYVVLVSLFPYQIDNPLQPICRSKVTIVIYTVMISFDMCFVFVTLYFSGRTMKIPFPMNEFPVSFPGFYLIDPFCQEVLFFLNTFTLLEVGGTYFSLVFEETQNNLNNIRWGLIVAHGWFGMNVVLVYHVPKMFKQRKFQQIGGNTVDVKRRALRPVRRESDRLQSSAMLQSKSLLTAVSASVTNLQMNELQSMTDDELRDLLESQCKELNNRKWAKSKNLRIYRMEELPQMEEDVLQRLILLAGLYKLAKLTDYSSQMRKISPQALELDVTVKTSRDITVRTSRHDEIEPESRVPAISNANGLKAELQQEK